MILPRLLDLIMRGTAEEGGPHESSDNISEQFRRAAGTRSGTVFTLGRGSCGVTTGTGVAARYYYTPS